MTSASTWLFEDAKATSVVISAMKMDAPSVSLSSQSGGAGRDVRLPDARARVRRSAKQQPDAGEGPG